jgi:hypothetical protein
VVGDLERRLFAPNQPSTRELSVLLYTHSVRVDTY